MAEKKTTQSAKSKSAAGQKKVLGRLFRGKNAREKKPTAKQLEEMEQARFRERRRFWSFIMFFYGIFELIVTFVKGDGLWNALYDLNRGLLGASVFVFGIFIIYLALTIASEKIAQRGHIARSAGAGNDLPTERRGADIFRQTH